MSFINNSSARESYGPLLIKFHRLRSVETSTSFIRFGVHIVGERRRYGDAVVPRTLSCNINTASRYFVPASFYCCGVRTVVPELGRMNVNFKPAGLTVQLVRFRSHLSDFARRCSIKRKKKKKKNSSYAFRIRVISTDDRTLISFPPLSSRYFWSWNSDARRLTRIAYFTNCDRTLEFRF